MDRMETAIARAPPPEMAGYHRLRARSAGRGRYIDFLASSGAERRWKRPSSLAHKLRDDIFFFFP